MEAVEPATISGSFSSVAVMVRLFVNRLIPLNVCPSSILRYVFSVLHLLFFKFLLTSFLHPRRDELRFLPRERRARKHDAYPVSSGSMRLEFPSARETIQGTTDRGRLACAETYSHSPDCSPPPHSGVGMQKRIRASLSFKYAEVSAIGSAYVRETHLLNAMLKAEGARRECTTFRRLDYLSRLFYALLFFRMIFRLCNRE